MVFYVDKAYKKCIDQIDFSEMKSKPIIEINNKQLVFTINESELELLKDLITEEIVAKGMINQDIVNELGKELYGFYDEITYQSKHQSN